MNFSSISLLKLQRLSRVVKKELQVTVQIRSKEGIGNLLRRAASESLSAPVFEAHSDFMSTLTEQDKTELISYNVSISPESHNIVTEIAPHKNTGSEQENSPPVYPDRRQKNIPVTHDRRKKEQHYRGAAVKNDRRKKQGAYQGEDRRGQTGERRGQERHDTSEEHGLEGQHTYHGRSYRGVAIDEETAHKTSEKAKHKHKGMYRGQEIDYDDDK